MSALVVALSTMVSLDLQARGLTLVMNSSIPLNLGSSEFLYQGLVDFYLIYLFSVAIHNSTLE